MPKKHYCVNGISVPEQVLKFQSTRLSDDYLMVQLYYDSYKDTWYKAVSKYLDRPTFDAEFDFRLIRAVETFNAGIASDISKSKGWSDIGQFNRWFWTCLSNWTKNVISSSYRLKTRPSVQCPVCCRLVTKVDQLHLKHYKTVKDLPKFVTWKGSIYEVYSIPRILAVCWGKVTHKKRRELNDGNKQLFIQDKHRVEWPWWHTENHKGVLCPFTHRIVEEINADYIKTLPDKYSRYAEPMSWEFFAEQYPSSLIQSEMYSLDYEYNDEDGKTDLGDYIAKDHRLGDTMAPMSYNKICNNDINIEYEHVFHTIDQFIEDDTDRTILKLLTVGHTSNDIGDVLNIDKKDVRKRIKNIRDSHKELEESLIEDLYFV